MSKQMSQDEILKRAMELNKKGVPFHQAISLAMDPEYAKKFDIDYTDEPKDDGDGDY